MAFRGLMVVRDEDDILPECLTDLLTWLDKLYVLDLGSTDRTWEIINEAALRDRRVVPSGRQPMVFHDNLRSVLFDRHRSEFARGDWIARVDADEFYHIRPDRFMGERVRRSETAVYLFWYYFRLTSAEVSAYASGTVDVMADRSRPIAERRRFYKLVSYPEPRFFRYRSGMRWPEFNNAPFNMGYAARERIPIRHYPHRDPPQMEKRYRLRSAMSRLNASAGPHWALPDWKKDVIDLSLSPSGRTEQTANQGLVASSGHTEAELSEWTAGTELPDPHLHNHLPAFPTRLCQRLIHPLLLPILDARRPAFSRDYRPELLSEEANAAIGRA
jgi:hypothetical protein